MFKVDNWENRSSCNICLQFTIKPPKRNRKNERSHSDQIHVQFHKVKKLEQYVITIMEQEGCQEISF